jgi:hypothetical protein
MTMRELAAVMRGALPDKEALRRPRLDELIRRFPDHA